MFFKVKIELVSPSLGNSRQRLHVGQDSDYWSKSTLGSLWGEGGFPDSALCLDLSDLYMSVHFRRICYTYTHVLCTFLYDWLICDHC